MDCIKTYSGKILLLSCNDYPVRLEIDKKTYYIHITGLDQNRRVMTTVPTVLTKTVPVRDKPEI